MEIPAVKDKRNLRKWVKALRSGKYKQTRGILHNAKGGGYCCLGLACEISGLDKFVPSRFGDNSLQYLNHSNLLPPAVVEWLGFDEYELKDFLSYPTGYDIPLLTKSGAESSASKMNDDQKANFGQIADAIERTYLVKRKAKKGNQK